MITEKELSVLLGEVEKEFSSYLTKAETTLAKSEDVKSKPKEKKEEKEDKPEAKEENNDSKPEQKDGNPFAEKQADTPAAPSDEQDAIAPDAQNADAAQAPLQDEGHGYDDEDMAHMQSMYSSMSRAELIAHHDAVKMALDNMGMEQDAPPQMGAPDQAAPPMMKSETDVVIEVKPEIVTSQETELLKSELATKTGEIEKLNKTLEAVTAFVTKLVEKKGAPQGKAITQLDVIAKSEEIKTEKTFTKNEITQILNSKASDTKLQKSDREAINAYYESGQININGISHLLNK